MAQSSPESSVFLVSLASKTPVRVSATDVCYRSMEIVDMVKSWIENFKKYVKERFPLRVFAPLVFVLVAAAFASGIPERAPDLIMCVFAIMILVFQFRLWDDLADRN